MATIKERIEEDLIAAMKARDEATRDTLRMLAAAIKNKEIEEGGELKEEDFVSLLRREAKTREEAVTQYTQAGSPERAAKETAEKKIIEGYLPAGISDEEVKTTVASAVQTTGASSMQDMGKVMKEVMGKVAGRADGTKVAAEVKKQLA